MRATHGTGLLKKLSNDLTKDLGKGFSVHNLQRMRTFYLSNPKYSTSSILDWSHYVELMPVRDQAKRKQLENIIVREDLSIKALRRLVKAEVRRKKVIHPTAPPELLTPVRGTLYTYRILTPKAAQPAEAGLLLIDLGFACSRDADEFTRKRFKAGDVIQSVKTASGSYQLQKKDVTSDALYTYQATVEKVVDGDTLLVIVDLGFNTRTRQYLRLRGIDAPEMDTKAGKQAADFVKKRIAAVSQIILTSSRSDKYGRYLADIFFIDSQGREVYLNNLLLETAHAVRM